MSLDYAAHTRLLGPKTVWTLEDGRLIERRGKRPARVFDLSTLRRGFLAQSPGPASGRRLTLVFPRGLIHLPSISLQRLAPPQDQGPAFAAFARAVCAAAADAGASARFGLAQAPTTLTKVMALTLGATLLGLVLVLLGAAASGAWGLGLDISARLAFVLTLLAAVAPWTRGFETPAFDPRDIPADLIY